MVLISLELGLSRTIQSPNLLKSNSEARFLNFAFDSSSANFISLLELIPRIVLLTVFTSAFNLWLYLALRNIVNNPYRILGCMKMLAILILLSNCSLDRRLGLILYNCFLPPVIEPVIVYVGSPSADMKDPKFLNLSTLVIVFVPKLRLISIDSIPIHMKCVLSVAILIR